MSMVPEEASIQSSSNMDERPASSSEPPSSIEKERELQTTYESKERQIQGGTEIQTAFDQEREPQNTLFGENPIPKEQQRGSAGGQLRSRAASTLAQVKTVGAISTSADAINQPLSGTGGGSSGHTSHSCAQNGYHHHASGMNTLPR